MRKLFVLLCLFISAVSWPAFSQQITSSGAVQISNLAPIGANTMLGNWSSSTGSVAAQSMPSCADSGGNHLNYVSGTGVTCGTSASGGSWANVSFASGNFTGIGTITWTVTSGEQTTYSYVIVGNTMTVAFEIDNSTVAGTGATLQIAIPASKTATLSMWNACYAIDNGARTTAVCRVIASSNVISISRTDFANWAASTTNTGVYGTLTFQIN